MIILKGILYYILCLIVFGAALPIAHYFTNNGNIIFLLLISIYLICGIFLNKSIFNKAVFYNSLHGTINNIANDKLTNVIFWIIKFPLFLFKLTIVKIL